MEEVEGFQLSIIDSGASRHTSVPTTTSTTSQESVQHDPAPRSVHFQATRFAIKNEIALWFPPVHLDDENSPTWRIWSSRRSRALMLQILLILSIFTVNLVWAILTYTRLGPSTNGVGLIYQGDCDKVGNLNLWLHLLINVFSTGMLGASNYCMQLQAAPTRADVDEAHRVMRWVDIGVPSLRNLQYIRGWRRASWMLLALSSMPIHFL